MVLLNFISSQSGIVFSPVFGAHMVRPAFEFRGSTLIDKGLPACEAVNVAIAAHIFLLNELVIVRTNAVAERGSRANGMTIGGTRGEIIPLLPRESPLRFGQSFLAFDLFQLEGFLSRRPCRVSVVTMNKSYSVFFPVLLKISVWASLEWRTVSPTSAVVVTEEVDSHKLAFLLEVIVDIANRVVSVSYTHLTLPTNREV